MTIDFNLTHTTPVVLEVVDGSGRVITTKHFGNLPLGPQNMVVDLSSLANGMYLVTLTTGENMITKRFIKN